MLKLPVIVYCFFVFFSVFCSHLQEEYLTQVTQYKDFVIAV